MENSLIIFVLLFWPLGAALLLALLRPANTRMLAFVASLVELIGFVFMLYQFPGAGNLKVTLPWIPSLGISFSLGLDGISMLLVLLTTGLVPFIILSSQQAKSKSPNFYALILVMEMALIGVFTALDGFLFYVFWEVALIPIYFICLVWGGENKGAITFKFFIYTLTGSLLMLVALLYIYYQTPGSHTFNIEALYSAGRNLPTSEQGIIFWGLFLAFAIKIPIFPFHTWQPDTYTVAPTEGTMLLSGIMLKMGFYGIIRWLIPMVPVGVTTWAFTAIILSVIGIIYASVIALNQKDFKRLVAYASVAHVGLISAGILTLSKIGLQGALIQMLSHGILAVGMFFICDIISARTNTRLISSLGGLRLKAPILTTVFLVMVLGTVALPFTSGFVGEFLLINSLFQYNVIVGAVAGLTIILGAVYLLRAFQYMMLGKDNVQYDNFPDLTMDEKLVLYPIVIAVFFIGIHPDPLLAISEVAASDILKIFSTFSANVR